MPQLKQFHQTLLWPLRLIWPHNTAETLTKLVSDTLATTPWQKTTLSDTKTDPITRYATQVYFHPFIRQFLYGNADTAPAITVWKRTDIKTAQVTLSNDHTFTLAVKRLQFYLFEIGIGIFVIEVSSQNIQEIQEIEDFLDQFRRAYPPYWDKQGKAGHSPRLIEFFTENNPIPIVTSNFEDLHFFQEDVLIDKNFPIAQHWQYLLQPLVRYQNSKTDSDKIRYQQIEDERMPYMAHLAFDDPHALSRGDMIRLALADGAGSSDSYPYATAFLKDFEERYCYDRFWEENPNSWMKTRYTCCGYAFTMIGEYYMGRDRNGDPEPGFFIDETAGGLSHFHHHYFIMGLIVHFHKAALLALWDQLAQAVSKFTQEEASRREFKKEVHDILEQLLHFTHRYWFTEVSNQVQPKELFDWWSDHLGTRTLFERVMKEAQDAHQFLEMEEQTRQTDTSVRLTVVATFGLVIGLALGFFGADPDVLGKWLTAPHGLWLIAAMVISFFFLMGVVAFSVPLARLLERVATFSKRGHKNP